MPSDSGVTANAIDQRHFRRALGNFATGVTVITACDARANPVGVTASSFNSVSLTPPLILWSLDKGARSRPVFETAEHFVVNVLSADQVTVSESFARQSEDKFHGIAWRQGCGGAPLLEGCAATFECRKTFVYEGGDHLIFVGEVLDFAESGRPGLGFYRGEYSISEPHPQRRQSAAHVVSGFVADHLDYLLSQAAATVQRGFFNVLDRAQVRQLEWRVLATLGDHDQGLSGGEISLIDLIPSAELEELLDGMRARDWVRVTRAADGTNVYHLTPVGQAKLVPLQVAASAHEADGLGCFTAAEVRQLKNMLKRLATTR